MYGYTQDKEAYLRRLRALQSAALGLMEDHLAHRVTQAAAEGGDTAMKIFSCRTIRVHALAQERQ